VRPARHSRSMEAELRQILKEALSGEKRRAEPNLAEAIRRRFYRWAAPTSVSGTRRAGSGSAPVRSVIVLDTNVLSELMRSKPAAAVFAWVSAQPRHALHRWRGVISPGAPPCFGGTCIKGLAGEQAPSQRWRRIRAEGSKGDRRSARVFAEYDPAATAGTRLRRCGKRLGRSGSRPCRRVSSAPTAPASLRRCRPAACSA
jgi:hypothetical protein